MNKKDLWKAIEAYQFEHLVPERLWDKVQEVFGGEKAAAKAFADKLVRKHRWSPGFAKKVIKEYKKFVYLGLVGDCEVTPSKTIDKVWHEHGLFMQGYRDFCDKVLNRQFDHMPELIPIDEETGVFSAQYLDTLALYKKEFGVDPPEDVWGKPKFDLEKVQVSSSRKKKKEEPVSNGSDAYLYDTNPLHTYFPDHTYHPEFSPYGGNYGGGGASGKWDESNSGDSNNSSSHSSHSEYATVDSTSHDSGGHSDGGGHGGDSGGGSSCGSSCSSSCGGGGCGGS